MFVTIRCVCLIRLAGPFLIVHLVALVCPPGLGRCILPFIAKLGSGLSWLLDWESLDGGISVGCPLSMVFIVALYVSWCRRLETAPLVSPQLHADNLNCSSVCPQALFVAARFTVQYVRAVSQDVSLGKCLLLSTSKLSGKA